MRTVPALALAGILGLAALPVAAQGHGGHHHAEGGEPATPYAGLDVRPVKALSDEQVEDLRAGRGMGLALAAELNGYPGPLHALELASDLDLSADQRAQTEALLAAMRAEAIPLGERLIAEEAALDRLFAERRITPETLAASTAQVGATEAELRAVHLGYHLRMLDVLTPDQVATYAELRLYN